VRSCVTSIMCRLRWCSNTCGKISVPLPKTCPSGHTLCMGGQAGSSSSSVLPGPCKQQHGGAFLHFGKGRICLVCALAQWLNDNEGQQRWGESSRGTRAPAPGKEPGPEWVPPSQVGHIWVQGLRAVASRYSLSTYKKDLRTWWGTHTLLLCWRLSLKELRKLLRLVTWPVASLLWRASRVCDT
jgi:hypothetical protein